MGILFFGRFVRFIRFGPGFLTSLARRRQAPFPARRPFPGRPPSFFAFSLGSLLLFSRSACRIPFL
ncbi:hypothetical protein HMPREF9440_01313 [Sutterella parvirubra YIT 11816]|uniref:Uncharacterized protein n=1 Tax=Sutterella parvirubra YIT 11816 TaxID=762967 RepID=H3KEZ9_9BURK|nr:hypothetical protein HMPREF9440_01313 [Sutterella parvirubra YIT 11816]